MGRLFQFTPIIPIGCLVRVQRTGKILKREIIKFNTMKMLTQDK